MLAQALSSLQSVRHLPASNARLLRLGDDLDVGADLRGARNLLKCYNLAVTYRLGRTLNFNETHATISGNGEAFVVAEARNLDSSLCTRLVDC